MSPHESEYLMVLISSCIILVAALIILPVEGKVLLRTIQMRVHVCGCVDVRIGVSQVCIKVSMDTS